MKELSKTYNPKNVEDKWYKKWEDNKAFSPNDNSKIEDEVRKEVVDLCSKFPIYKNLR